MPMDEPTTAFDMNSLDLRLLEVSGELYALEENLQLIEEQMEQTKKTEGLRIKELIRDKALFSDDSDRQLLLDEFNYRMECVLPRFFRGSFLVALYAVYESAVTEIANLLQKSESGPISMTDFKGDFLDRAKKYYSHILRFELYGKEKEWHRIKMLSVLRNAFAHANGRVETLPGRTRKTIRNWERQKLGISTHNGFIICDSAIVSDMFGVIKESLENLISRYKARDDGHER